MDKTCRTPHGVRGLKFANGNHYYYTDAGRTPHGVRGLKSWGWTSWTACWRSHPSWGAWIEIAATAFLYSSRAGRTPHGVRGLKSEEAAAFQ